MGAEANDYVFSLRLPRSLSDRLHAYAAEKAEAQGTPVTIAQAVRLLLDRGLTDATRVRKSAPRRKG
jgi:hypothetical protein